MENEEIKNRAQDTNRNNDSVKDISIGLEQIDSIVKYHIENNIKPQVEDNNVIIQVPVIYGTPERWSSVSKYGYFRDKERQLQVPLIMFKRTSHDVNRDLSRNLDANKPEIHQTMMTKYTQFNQYDRFSILSNTKKQKEFHNVIVPNYIKINYDCIIWTYKVFQLNKIVEAFNYADSSYWGDKDKYMFHCVINSFDKSIDISEGEDRMVKSNFSISLNGYLISDAIQKQLNETSQKTFSMTKIIMTENLT
jgi:hypothetical protein